MATETEYKFLVHELPPGAEDGLDFEPISQGYICGGPPMCRVRRKGPRGYLTLKGPATQVAPGGPLTRAEFEYEIPAGDADAILALCPTRVQKRRARLATGLELDIFEGALAGLVLAEMECELGAPPPEEPAGWRWEDVSARPEYANRALAELGLPPGVPLLARFRRR
jgi:adenylate cyclase